MTNFFIPCLVVFHYLLLIVILIDVVVTASNARIVHNDNVSVQYNTNYDNDEDDYNNDDDNDNEPIHVYLLSGQSNSLDMVQLIIWIY
jgi:hypothetical protein